MRQTEADVLIVGGGTAGAVAAIQAGRAGARTALVERSGLLGGTLTGGGVSFPGLFHAWGRQVVAGIGWELVTRAVELEGEALPDFAAPPRHHWQHQVRVNPALYACLAEEACLAAGVEILYHELPVSIARQGDSWVVETVGKGLRRRIRCREVVDCTGDADTVALAGFERVRGETRQPGTLIFRLGGYDAARLDAEEIQRRYEAALAEGRMLPGDFSSARGRFVGFLQGGGNNAQHVFAADSSTAPAQTETNVRGRQSLLRLLRFVRSLPGCENARVLEMQPDTAVRETYRIAGEATVTLADYVSGRLFPDAVCHAFYPVDLHTEEGITPEPLRPGVVPTIPFGALIPRGSTHLLAAGRCVSSDRGANSALRVQAPCMAMGQATGAAAALGARLGIPSRDVPLPELQALLREHGAVVPGAMRDVRCAMCDDPLSSVCHLPPRAFSLPPGKAPIGAGSRVA